MEDINDVIVLPWELERDLPKDQRNLVKILCDRPEGVYSHELFVLMGSKNPSSARYSCKAELAKHGLEIHCESWTRGVEGLWTIQRIIIPSSPKKEIEPQEKSQFNIGDTVYFATCKFNEANIRNDCYVVNPKDLRVSYGILENKEAVIKAELMGCFSSHIHVVKALSASSVDLIK